MAVNWADRKRPLTSSTITLSSVPSREIGQIEEIKVRLCFFSKSDPFSPTLTNEYLFFFFCFGRISWLKENSVEPSSTRFDK